MPRDPSSLSTPSAPGDPRLSEVDQLPLTLLDGKGFMYATLGSGLAPLPAVVTVREPSNLHDRTTSSLDLSQFPPAVVVANVLTTRHNRYLQGLGKSTKPFDVDCSTKRLQDIQVDHDEYYPLKIGSHSTPSFHTLLYVCLQSWYCVILMACADNMYNSVIFLLSGDIR